MAKLWDKGFNVSKRIEDFTVGKDRELDLLLAPYDIQGTIAHITMLESVGLLGKDELDALTKELKSILRMAENGSFRIDDDVEDVHSQVELMLTEKLGDLGKKVHTGRSRNDQVLLDVKLFTRAGIKKTALKVKALFDALMLLTDTKTSSCPDTPICRWPCRHLSDFGSEHMRKHSATICRCCPPH